MGDGGWAWGIGQGALAGVEAEAGVEVGVRLGADWLHAGGSKLQLSTWRTNGRVTGSLGRQSSRTLAFALTLTLTLNLTLTPTMTLTLTLTRFGSVPTQDLSKSSAAFGWLR